jgi:hypothetical protein
MWRRYVQVVGLALVALGVGAIALAGVDWAVDENPALSGLRADTPQQEPNMVLHLLIGGSSLIGGAVLMLVAARRRRHDPGEQKARHGARAPGRMHDDRRGKS